MSTRQLERATAGHKTASIRRVRLEPTPPAGGRRRTVTTRSSRSAGATRPNRPGDARAERRLRRYTAGVDGRMLDQVARPIAAEKRLLRSVTGRLAGAIVTLAVLVALLAILFVLPVQTWMQQRDDLQSRRRELDMVRQANATLEAEIAQLQTPQGIERAAREQLGYVRRGERQYTIVDTPDSALVLPTGWPFDAVAHLVQGAQPAT